MIAQELWAKLNNLVLVGCESGELLWAGSDEQWKKSKLDEGVERVNQPVRVSEDFEPVKLIEDTEQRYDDMDEVDDREPTTFNNLEYGFNPDDNF